MIISLAVRVWLCLCLSLLFAEAIAQEPISVEVRVGDQGRAQQELPLFQVGIELSRPISFPLGMIMNWKNPIPLEGLFQYRLSGFPIYGQLYGGYFQGDLHYENGYELRQKGFYLKPGLLWVAKNKGLRHSFTLEVNLIFSWGEIAGENTLYGPIFGNYEASASLPIASYGVETGIGADVVQVGSFKLKAVGRMFLCSQPERDVPYIPGAGYTGFLGVGVGASVYIMHAWRN